MFGVGLRVGRVNETVDISDVKLPQELDSVNRWYNRHMSYYVYILECADKTLYTGYTTDLEKRVSIHNTAKTAAKYTKVRRPVKLFYSEKLETKSDALKREWAIKKMSRQEKLVLATLQ
ncbi:MAG: hypothetical protein RJB39_441 [Candidatus Parcubacteria bacterium]|jgi:putative endonuclease